jgi:DNA replication protein DnaC
MNAVNQAMVPARYGMATLEAFSNFTENGREVLAILKDWLRSFDPKGSPGLILGGATGVGKTYLISALALGLVKQGHSVRFIDFFQLLSDLRAAYAENKAGEELMRPLIHADLLVIDELGKGRHNDFELSVIDQLVMGRYNQRKITLATTNYSLKAERKFAGAYSFENDGRRGGGFGLDEMESLEARIGKRTYSRLYETSKIIELSGNDFRRPS